MRVDVRWEIEVVETYRATIELPAEVVERVTALRAEGLTLHAALLTYETETDYRFDLESLVLDDETDANEIDCSTSDRTILHVQDAADECDECGMPEPLTGCTSCFGRHHATSCSLHPDNIVGPVVYDHDARPDDLPELGDRCKDCGDEIVWQGPSQYDWLHVKDARNQ